MKVKIPKQEIDVKSIVTTVLAKPSAPTLARIERTKKFVTAVMHGKSVAVAKRDAGISPQTPTKTILESPLARLVVKELIDRKFNNKKYLKKLRQLWDANDRRATKDGDIYDTPNWPTQLAAFDRVTKIRQLVAEDNEDRQPGGITIQIVGEGNVQLKDQIP